MRDALRGTTDPADVVRLVRDRVADFEAEAHSILGSQETASKSRVISVDHTRAQLQGLSVRQHDLLGEALDCVQYGIYRAAHVVAWQAFIDLLQEKLTSDGLVKVKQVRPNWTKVTSLDELRDEVSEYHQVEVARVLNLLTKGEMKTLHGMLSTRNLCAHPSSYKPGLNTALGYVSALINWMAQLQPKTL